MRSIERRFLDLEQKRPLHSSFLNFGAAIKGQNFSEVIIRRWFNKLVEKDDYASTDKRALIAHLLALSNSAVESRKQGMKGSLEPEQPRS